MMIWQKNVLAETDLIIDFGSSSGFVPGSCYFFLFCKICLNFFQVKFFFTVNGLSKNWTWTILAFEL